MGRSAISDPGSTQLRTRKGSEQRRAAVALLAFSALWYLVMSYWSDGFYGHDEINHYLRAVAFWDDPSSILSYWQRPGFKLLYVLPSLAGIKLVHVVTIILTVATGLFAWRIACRLELANPYLTALFFAFQPLLLQLSFRMHAEVLAGFLLTLVLLLYFRENWHACAVLTGYLFTVRQEFALVGVALGILLILRKDIASLLLLAAAPAILAVLGWLHSGNPLWIVQDYTPLTTYDVLKPGFWHYWRHFTIIFGAPVTVFFGVGVARYVWFAAIRKKQDYRIGVIVAIFATFFLLQCLLTAHFVSSPSPGHFRYLLYLAPLVALLANVGFNTLWEMKSRGRSVLILLIPWIVFAWFTTFHHNYFEYYHLRDTLSLVVFIVMGIVLTLAFARHVRTQRLLPVITVLLFAHTFVTERPIAPDSETEAVKDCARWYAGTDLADSPILTNNVTFAYMLGPELGARMEIPSLYVRTLDAASTGTVIVWDSHYGSHPNQGTDVSREVISGRADLQELAEFSAPEFEIIVLRKTE